MRKESRLSKLEKRVNGPDRKRSGALPISVFNQLADIGDPNSDLTEAEKQERLKELRPQLQGFDPTRLNEIAAKRGKAYE